MGIVSAVPWIGVPVTTPRLAAVMFNAKDAADSSERIAPSTDDPANVLARRQAMPESDAHGKRSRDILRAAGPGRVPVPDGAILPTQTA